MTEIFGIPLQALYGQLLLGLVNGSFYALLSLGLAVIFGLLGIVQLRARRAVHDGRVCRVDHARAFRHQLLVRARAVAADHRRARRVIERLLLKRLYKLDPVYGLLLTFGLALIAEGIFRDQFGVSGQSYAVPRRAAGRDRHRLHGAAELSRVGRASRRSRSASRPGSRSRRRSLGATLRAGTENAALVQAFGVNVPLMVTLTYGAGVALAALAGVLAAPIIQVTPLMGSNLIIVVFAVVVIGGMGSILGSILTGLLLGLVEGLTRVFYPEASQRRRLRDHDRRAAVPAGRPVREGNLTCSASVRRSSWWPMRC